VIADYEIRLASPADTVDISSLSRDAIEHGLAWSWTPRRVAQCIADRSTNVAVVRQQGTLLGFAIMSYGDENAHMQLFAVHPAYRNRGLGTALLSWLEQTARVAGMAWILLEARTQNEAARSFYRRRGFIEVGFRKGYYQGVEDAVRLARNLRLPP
jgi:[ribosomal protein S18]-alanine N-acetyltransferase